MYSGLGCRVPSYARAAIDTDGSFALNRRPADDPFLVAVIVNGVVLGGGIVPDRQVARIPAPADRVFGLCDMGLEKFEQGV